MGVGDCFQVNFFQTVKGNPLMNVFHFFETVAASNDEDSPASIVDSFRDEIAVEFAAELSEDWIGVGVQVLGIFPGPIIPYSELYTGGAAVQGQQASEALPSNAPAVITKYTSTASRRGRGRWYQSGIPESYQDGGQLTVAGYAALNAALSHADDLLTELGAGTGRWKLAVLSPTDNVIRVVQSLVLRPNIANLRPRRSPAATV